MFHEMISELMSRGANFIKVVDISTLPASENQGYNVAVLIGIVLSPGYIYKLSQQNINDCSEFSQKERAADHLAEWTADFIKAKKFKAFAQSERNLLDGFYDANTKSTSLPHKKIAIMAGLGWIGKSNLLVTKEYGSGFCMCSVLTDAPLPTQNEPMLISRCGDCDICKEICPSKVIHGSNWEVGINRDSMVDVYKCETCLKCLVNCVWTQKYMKNNILNRGDKR